MKKALLIIVSSLLSLILLGCLSFYLLIVAGLSPSLQEMWVCSAMRTLNHKYLATAFISQEKIDEIMAKNEVDDSGMDSEIIEFEKLPDIDIDINIETDTERKPVDPYVSEGYSPLEEGIYLKEVNGATWRGFVMMITDPKRVKLAQTKYQFEKGQTVMKMTEQENAIAGVNGGGFQDGANYDSNGGMPAGLLIVDGKLIYPETPDDRVYNMIGINKDGVLVLRHTTASWALENDIVSAVSFSPFLVVNGEGTVKNGSGGWGIAPRTAIGQRETGEFIFLVIDGRQVNWSIGVDLDVLQEVLLKEKCINGAMMDGGSSTALVYDGDYVNKPSLGHERWINNCWVVSKLEENQETE